MFACTCSRLTITKIVLLQTSRLAFTRIYMVLLKREVILDDYTLYRSNSSFICIRLSWKPFSLQVLYPSTLQLCLIKVQALNTHPLLCFHLPPIIRMTKIVISWAIPLLLALVLTYQRIAAAHLNFAINRLKQVHGILLTCALWIWVVKCQIEVP